MTTAELSAQDRAFGPELYGPELSRVYDLLYRGRGKDFKMEAAVVARVVRARKPDAVSLLDVACGTGEHLVSLRSRFNRVEGLELSEDMRAVAVDKLPDVPIHVGDMRRFELNRTFDAMCCLFSTIAYMASNAELDAAIDSMARHLTPGGVLVLEPWWFPQNFLDGYVSDAVVRDHERTVLRVSHSKRSGDVVRQEAHFIVATSSGIRHIVDVQRLNLFTRADYMAAFNHAACDAEYVNGDEALSDRGLFVGIRR
jgi:SAM-dependent methyltransferase